MNTQRSALSREAAAVVDPARMATAATSASGLMKILGHPDRLMVMCQLVDGEKSVGEIARLNEISQPALSQHLARLRKERLVESRREAQMVYYSLASEEASRVVRLLYDLYCRSGRRSSRKRKS